MRGPSLVQRVVAVATDAAVAELLEPEAARSHCRMERAKGVSHTQRVAVKGEPRFVKVIVYDYTADLTGTALVMIPSPK